MAKKEVKKEVEKKETVAPVIPEVKKQSRFGDTDAKPKFGDSNVKPRFQGGVEKQAILK